MGPKTGQNEPYVDPGCFRASRETAWTVWEASWGSLGGVMGRLGRVLGDLGGVLDASWARLGAAWGGLGASWGGLGRLRCVLEALWRAAKKLKNRWFYTVFGHPGSEEDVQEPS